MNKTSVFVSAVVIAKNEEARIGTCLSSLAWANEIIVVDNGSTDKTIEIAKKYKAIIVESKAKDFSLLRIIGLNKTVGTWVLYVDADEEVPKALANEILTTINQNAESAYQIKRKNYYLGNEWPYQDRLERLFQKKYLQGWTGMVHETPIVRGSIGTLRNPLIHYTHRTIAEMVAKTNEWSLIEAQLRLEAHHPQVVWWRFFRVMLTGFYDSYIKQKGWKAGIVGWIESIYQAFSMFITYAKLWEMQCHCESRSDRETKQS